MDEVTALLALSRVKGSETTAKKWMVENAWERGAPSSRGRTRPAMGPQGGDRAFSRVRGDRGRPGRACPDWAIEIVTIKDDGYPALQGNTRSRPSSSTRRVPCLFTGAFAIVGARKATFEGMLLAERIAETLSSAGITVVSGLARGIDGAAHRGALRRKGRDQSAVLGCGIDTCYPAENWPLLQGDG